MVEKARNDSLENYNLLIASQLDEIKEIMQGTDKNDEVRSVWESFAQVYALEWNNIQNYKATA
jgi:hypothetical protein